MGMAASQARLLSITARLSDNEQTSQALSFAKERLADRSEQITDEYNNALSATKLQIMTGYADGTASFSDVSFSMLSCPQVLTLGKQYIVTNPEGKVLVDNRVAQAFLTACGSCNVFLGILGYSISDVNPSLKASDSPQTAAHDDIIEKIHQAWDRYFVSIGKTDYDSSDPFHPWVFQYHNRPNVEDFPGAIPVPSRIGNGYATITMMMDDGSGGLIPDPDHDDEILAYEGTTQAQLDLYNYAMAITESFYSIDETTPYQINAHDFMRIKTNYSMDNTSEITYYKNLFDKMLSAGFYSYTNTPALAASDPDHWIYQTPTATPGTTDGSPLNDAHTFEEYLRSGKLILNSFSKTKSTFEKISVSSDTCFQEVQDKTKIAQAEAKYTNDLKQLEKLDSRYDLQLKRLDTEHNTLQTEYESVKKVISNNVQNSFKTFG